MANCTDAFGTITVERVGQEFLDYLKEVQGSDEKAYYKLVEPSDLIGASVDKNNNLELNFSTFGRWSYEANIAGYLDGQWMKDEPAYNKFVEAMVLKNGRVGVDYTDSDTAMDWMGKGYAELEVVDGDVSYSESFEGTGVTLEGYKELYELSSEYEAIERIYGDDVATAYYDYKEKLEKENKQPDEFDVWFESYEF